MLDKLRKQLVDYLDFVSPPALVTTFQVAQLTEVQRCSTPITIDLDDFWTCCPMLFKYKHIIFVPAKLVAGIVVLTAENTEYLKELANVER